jgi:hypothetical protein
MKMLKIKLVIFALVLALNNVGLGDTHATRRSDDRRAVPFRVWFNHDGTNILSNVSPWHKKGEPFTEAMLKASVDELAGIGIDAVAFNPGNGSVPWWQSKVYPDHWEWYTERTGKKPGSFGQYVASGGDMIKVFVDRCRQQGLAPIITFRLKDEHNIENLDSQWVSRFFFDHQDWRLDDSPRAVFGKRGLNWIFPEVPQERLRLLTEIAENYDIDGIELDFMRFFPFFDVESTTYSQRRDVMTGFIRSVRELLDRTVSVGRYRYLSIRVPNRLQEYESLGIDLAQLDREGLIDIINLSPSYVSQVESDITKVCAMAPKTAVFYEITHAASRGPSPSWGQYGDDYPIRNTTDQQFYTAANLAYARGAQGISLFNFAYTRPSSRSGTHSIGGSIGREPPYHVVEHLEDPEYLSKQPQHYWIPYWWKTGYNGRQFQLPESFAVGSEHAVELDMELPKVPATGARLRIRYVGGTPVLSATEPLPYYRGRPTLVWRARVNGDLLEPVADVSEPFDSPYDGFLGAPQEYQAWDVPTGSLTNGSNTITLELVDGPISDEFSVDVIWLDLAVFTDQ